jgi:uncharacterized protein
MMLYILLSVFVMSVSCEYIARRFLPLYRAFVAKELVEKHGYNQEQAAKKLGTTQPAISQYLSSKRGRKNIPNYNEIMPLIEEEAVKVAASVAKKEIRPEEFNDSFCEVCRMLQRTGKISMPQLRVKP